jgi:hypothetical protein
MTPTYAGGNDVDMNRFTRYGYLVFPFNLDRDYARQDVMVILNRQPCFHTGGTISAGCFCVILKTGGSKLWNSFGERIRSGNRQLFPDWGERLHLAF